MIDATVCVTLVTLVVAHLTIVNGKSNAYDGIRITRKALVMTEDQWAEKAKRLLRSEMVKHGVSYEHLSERLHEIGIEETPVNIRNKVARGKFMASFLLQCFAAMKVQVIRVEDA